MKKYCLLCMAVFMAMTPLTAFAGRGDESECENEDEYEVNPEDLEFCATHNTIRDGCDIIYSCKSCISGYVLVSNDTYNTCEPMCSTSTNCISDTTWTNVATGYQRKINRNCSDSTTCTETVVYRCATGYYGSSSNGTSGCTRCPSEDGATGTSAAGSTARTSCYIPSGTKFSNNTGSGQWTGNSFYCD